MFCFFESSDSGFTRYGGKPLEKLFERLSSFQIVEEGLDRHSRSTKHRSSAKNIPVFDDDSHETIVSWRMEHPNGKLGCTQKAFFGIKMRPPAKFLRLNEFLNAKHAAQRRHSSNASCFVDVLLTFAFAIL